MSFISVVDKKNKNPYDLNKISYRCKSCGGKKLPPTVYEMNGYDKYCRCGMKHII